MHQGTNALHDPIGSKRHTNDYMPVRITELRDGIEPRKSGSGLGFLTEERGPAAEAERSRLLAGGGGGGCGRETLARLAVGCCGCGPIRLGLISEPRRCGRDQVTAWARVQWLGGQIQGCG